MTYYLNQNPLTHDIPFEYNGKTYLFRKQFEPYRLTLIGTIDRYVFVGKKKEMTSIQWSMFRSEALSKLISKPTPKVFDK